MAVLQNTGILPQYYMVSQPWPHWLDGLVLFTL